jgi:hypothetical protein
LQQRNEEIVREMGRLSHLNLAECSAQRSIQLVTNTYNKMSVHVHLKGYSHEILWYVFWCHSIHLVSTHKERVHLLLKFRFRSNLSTVSIFASVRSEPQMGKWLVNLS